MAYSEKLSGAIEQVEQQIGFSATVNPRDNLHKTIMLVGNELLQVFATVKFNHSLMLFSKIGNMDIFCNVSVKISFFLKTRKDVREKSHLPVIVSDFHSVSFACFQFFIATSLLALA